MRTIPQFGLKQPATIEIENALLNAIGCDSELYKLVAERLNATTGATFEAYPVDDEENPEFWAFVIAEFDQHDTDGLNPKVWKIKNIDELLDVRHTDEESSSKIEFEDVTPVNPQDNRFYLMF